MIQTLYPLWLNRPSPFVLDTCHVNLPTLYASQHKSNYKMLNNRATCSDDEVFNKLSGSLPAQMPLVRLRKPERQVVTLEFNETQIFVVPEGVTKLRILAIGAAGGSGNGFGVLLGNGGEGGTAVSNIFVNHHESLEVFVGQKGGDGSCVEGGVGGKSINGFDGGTAATGHAGGGGGGGGASGVMRVISEEVLVVAGGGGGGSGVGNGGLIGRGGDGGSFGTNGHGLSPGKVKQGCGTRGGNGPDDSDLGSGGGGGGFYGGGAGSTCDINSSGGGAGGIGTVEGSMSSNGGGKGNGRVVISFEEPLDQQ